jgi:DNA polymerase III delta prime subunit
MPDDQLKDPLIGHLEAGPGSHIVIVNKLIGDIHTEVRPPISQDDRNRFAMIRRVREEWVDGVLKQSLYRVARIELHLETREDSVENALSTVVQVADRSPIVIPPGSSIAEVFDRLGQAILILGAPGTGKTTLLLELAAALLDRSLRDENHPIPVVFNLSTWGVKRDPLKKWLISELHVRSGVPRKLARRWVDNGEVLPLLDGLDEVAAPYRHACLDAIHAFRNEYGLLPMAVCCRIADFENLGVKAYFRGAIEVQPLTRKQIDDYLGKSTELLPLRAAIEKDSEVAALFDTPLMLSVAMLANREMQWESLEDNSDLERRRLFSSFLHAMFKRRAVGRRFSDDSTVNSLSWLATMLQKQHGNIFFLESLNPGWLPTRKQRWLAKAATVLACATVCAVVFALNDVLFSLLAGLHLRQLPSVEFAGLRGGAFLGVFIGLIGLFFNLKPAETIHLHFSDLRPRLRSALRPGLIGGVVSVLAFIAFGLLVGLSGGPTAIIEGGVFTGIVLGVLISLTTLLISERIESRRIANQGVRDSVKNALVIFVLSTLFMGSPMAVFILKFPSAIHAVRVALFIKHLGRLRAGLLLGFGAGSVFGLFGGMFGGGLYVLRHLVLRCFLWANRSIPWHSIAFLDYSSERLFLRKVGAGYIFMHRMLMDYFAALSTRKEPDTSR